MPSIETIATGEYPVSRPLFFYVKKAHLGVVPGLKEYVEFFLDDQMIGPDGPLAEYGLVPAPDAEREAQRAAFEAGTDHVSRLTLTDTSRRLAPRFPSDISGADPWRSRKGWAGCRFRIVLLIVVADRRRRLLPRPPARAPAARLVVPRSRIRASRYHGWSWPSWSPSLPALAVLVDLV